MVISARRRREMNGVRNDIRPAIGLAGGGANGKKDDVASARGIPVWLRRGVAILVFSARAARAVCPPEAAPVFPKKARKNISGNM